LTDLQALLKRLEADLLERSESAEVPEIGEALRAEYQRAKDAERTAANYEDWRTDAITQAAAAWVLSCVFVRFLEDNRLIDPPRIAGTPSVSSGRLSVVNGQLSMDSGQNRCNWRGTSTRSIFAPIPGRRIASTCWPCFDELAKLPGGDVFQHQLSVLSLPTTDHCQLTTDNCRNWLSGDAAASCCGSFRRSTQTRAN
jgi:hypothetical protein